METIVCHSNYTNPVNMTNDPCLAYTNVSTYGGKPPDSAVQSVSSNDDGTSFTITPYVNFYMNVFTQPFLGVSMSFNELKKKGYFLPGD